MIENQGGTTSVIIIDKSDTHTMSHLTPDRSFNQSSHLQIRDRSLGVELIIAIQRHAGCLWSQTGRLGVSVAATTARSEGGVPVNLRQVPRHWTGPDFRLALPLFVWEAQWPPFRRPWGLGSICRVAFG